MAKEYGSTVTYVRNGVEISALVAASSDQPDGAHLTLVYLDPTFAGQMLGGAGLQRAIATAFVVPLKEGSVNGWKDHGDVAPDQIRQTMMQLVETEPSKATLYVRPDATLAGLSGAPVEAQLIGRQPRGLGSVLADMVAQPTAADPVTVEVVEGKVPFGSRLLAPDANYHASTEDVAAALESQVEEQKIAAETAGPDGTTSPSESAPAQADVAAKEEHGDVGEASPAPPTE